MVALRSILGSPKTDYTNRGSPPSYPPQQYQAQAQQAPVRPYQKNEGGKRLHG